MAPPAVVVVSVVLLGERPVRAMVIEVRHVLGQQCHKT